MQRWMSDGWRISSRASMREQASTYHGLAAIIILFSAISVPIFAVHLDIGRVGNLRHIGILRMQGFLCKARSGLRLRHAVLSRAIWRGFSGCNQRSYLVADAPL